MRVILCGVSLLLFLIASGCNSSGVPVEFAKTCDKANDDTTIETVGYFNNTGSAMCSKSGNSPMRCPINFVGEPGAETNILSTEIDLGSGSSSIEDVEGKGLTIHDVNGEVVEKTDKVKIVAGVNVIDGGYDDKNLQGCFVKVYKIEKVK